MTMLANWKLIAAVFIGGGCGAVLRFVFSTAVTLVLGSGFPYGIFFTNIIGSTVMGILTEVFALRGHLPLEVRTFFTVGILGGFTTFSSYTLDGYLLLMRGQEIAAIIYVAGSVLLSLIGLYLGLHVTRWALA